MKAIICLIIVTTDTYHQATTSSGDAESVLEEQAILRISNRIVSAGRDLKRSCSPTA